MAGSASEILAAGRLTAMRQQSFLDRLDLQRQIFRIDAALRKAAGNEVEASLAGARIHVAQLLLGAKAPDRADARSDDLAEQLLHQLFLRPIAGCKHDQIGLDRVATLEPCAVGDKALDI